MITRTNAHCRKLRIENLESRKVMATVTGIVFNDVNGNVTQEVGEAPLSDRTVFIDLDGDSTVDAGEPSMLTGADGAYLFENLPISTTQPIHVALALPDREATGRWQNTNNNYEWFFAETGSSADQFNFGMQWVPYATFKPDLLQGEKLVAQTLKVFDSSTDYPWQQIASDDSGNYAAIFTTDAAAGKVQINLQLFNANGAPRGSSTVMTVNATGLSQTVTMSRDGSRVAVAWQQVDSKGSVAPFVQLLDNTGAKLGSQIQTAAFGFKNNTGAVKSELRGIEMDSVGNFAVLMRVTNALANNKAIQLQRYTRSGAISGSIVGFNPASLVNGDVRLAMDATGKFLVTWQETTGILAQRYSATGTVVGARLVVATDPTPASLRLGAVAMNSTGKFVVLWQADAYGTPRNVAKLFDASGNPVGLVNNITPPGTRGWPELATMNAAGDVTFPFVRDGGNFNTANGNTVAQFSASDVYVRQLSASGNLSESQIVSEKTAGIQTIPSIAQTLNGFVVSWLSSMAGGGQGMFTQQFQPIATSSRAMASAATNPISPDSADYVFSLSEDELNNKRNRSTR